MFENIIKACQDCNTAFEHNSDGSIFRDKSGLAWVNPYRKEVWEYLASVGEADIRDSDDEGEYEIVRCSADRRIKKVYFGAST